MRDQSGLHFYASSCQRPLASWKGNDDLALMWVEIGERSRHLVPRLEGGHRILLPEELADELIQALSVGEPVRIKTGRHQESLLSEGFEIQLQRLLSIDIPEGIKSTSQEEI